ncbi:MAG: hypothetical protein ABIT01_02765 [Thermoanaerobaculia bacterium]
MKGLRAAWSAAERSVLMRLSSPEAIQRFLDDELSYNKEAAGATLRSPRRVLRDRTAHCFEGALVAAAALRLQGRVPLIVLFRARNDDDHVLALFRERKDGGAWGAIAKSNYAGLRFREPVYRSMRELAMSYFEHYYNLEAEKTLRAVSRPLDLTSFDRQSWQTAEDDLWDLNDALAVRRLTPLLTAPQVRALRPVDARLERAGLLGSVGVPLWSGRATEPVRFPKLPGQARRAAR